MSEPGSEPDVPPTAESPAAREVPEQRAEATTPVSATDAAGDEEVAPPRSDSLAVGVAVLVMVALLACAGLVLIAAGNA